MKVSVIVVAHPDYTQYLPRTIQSLKAARLHNTEIFIINNGDDRELSKIIPESFIEVCTSKVNLATACNIGINLSNGEYIVRVDADDWVEPDLIYTEQKYLDEHLVDAVWCDYFHAYDKGKVIYLEHAPQDCLEHACGVMYKREVWEDLKYNEDLDFQESYDFWLRFQKKYKAERIPAPFYFYRKHQGSMSTNPERLEVRKKIDEQV